jgi:hypothetical protein
LTRKHAYALDDPERPVIDPDPRSVTGESVRVIGYSDASQEVLTVVVVIHDGRVYDATARRASAREATSLSGRGAEMTRQVKDDVAALTADEAAAIEAGRDTPILDSAKISRGNGRSKVLQIRLNPEELAELERVAAQRGLPTSTVAREAIIRLIRPEVARTASAKRLIDAFAQYVTTLGAADTSAPD